MKVEVEGATIRCYLDDMSKPLITYTDPVPFITGRAGFRAHDSVLRFDNFVVTPAPSNPTAIHTPEASASMKDNASGPVRYYNMLGQPISSPSSLPQGMYIRSQGGQSRVIAGSIR